MRSAWDRRISELAAGVAAWAIGVVCCEAAICVWHLAHSAVPTKFLREEADLVGHQAGDESMRSSVESEMVAFVFARYGRELGRHRQLRAAVLGFAVVSFAAAGVAGVFGAMINKHAPVQGGAVISLSDGGAK